MKKAILAVVCVFATSASVRAQDSFEKILDEMVPTFAKLNETLTKIKDKQSFLDTKPALEEIAKDLVMLKLRGQKLGELKGKMKDELEIKYKGKLEEYARKLSNEMIRIKALSGGEEMVKEISTLLSPLSVKQP